VNVIAVINNIFNLVPQDQVLETDNQVKKSWRLIIKLKVLEIDNQVKKSWSLIIKLKSLGA
jgi:hypothetical protein